MDLQAFYTLCPYKISEENYNIDNQAIPYKDYLKAWSEFDGYWCFYFIDRKNKYPDVLIPQIGEYLKTGKLFNHGSFSKDYIKLHEEFLKQLPDDFWKELEEIKAVEYRLCRDEKNIPIFNNYIGSYNDDIRLSWEPVTLMANDQKVKLNGIQYDKKTVKELFTEYGHNFDNVEPHTTVFVIGDFIIPDSTQVRPGETILRVVRPENLG